MKSLVYIVLFFCTLISSAQTISGQEKFDVSFYKIDLNVNDSSIYIEGSATIVLSLLSASDSLNFELVDGYTIDSVYVDDNLAKFSHKNDILSVDVPSEKEKMTIVVFYHGSAYEELPGDGIFHRRGFNDKGYTYTLTEPFAAKYFFPCKQVLDDKADSVHVFITTDNNLKAGANGRLVNSIPLADNKIRYEWKSQYPIAYYLISFAVGDYFEYSFTTHLDDQDSVFVQNYMYNDSSYFEDNKYNIDLTGNFLVLFSNLFGKYPFFEEKYGHCTVPIGGGMEHQTMTTLSNFSFLLVSHELAHQWFGDNVTCAEWNDIWINEGFASYGEYLAEEFLDSKDEANLWMAEAHEFIMSEPGGSVYVPKGLENDEDRLFDYRLSYKKGAAIIHMMRQEVNNDVVFFDVLTTFQERYKDSVATGEDFKALLEEKSGIDFTWFLTNGIMGKDIPFLKLTGFGVMIP
ncbi:MAG: M1 family metallopeptidase [Bacteroidales bacterium]|nr:M1 family metallopeptidase [Bacteroidales bacterium]